MSQVPIWGTPDLLSEICERSAAGEGVADILAAKGLDARVGLRWLRDHHHAEIVAAKQEQIKNKKKKDEVSPKTDA